MRQSFFGFNIAVSGLYTAQKNLNVVGHNISNASTTGYSKQVTVQSASKPLSVLDGTGMVGTGSEVKSVERIRDSYLDVKYWNENAGNGEWSKKAEALSDIETTFNEPSDSGFATIIDDFYSSLQELSKDPSSSAVRALVRENGVTLSTYFNKTATNLEEVQEGLNDQVKITVEQVNSYASQIQNLNKQIYTFELSGDTANDLRDARTVLVDKLSGLIDIDASEVSNGKLPNGEDDKRFVITVGGKNLVNHFSSTELVVEQRDEKLNAEDVENLYEVKWADGNDLVLSGGELKGLIDVRDGNEGAIGTDGKTQSPSYKGIAYYQGELNDFVRTFAMAFNEGYLDADNPAEDVEGHAAGYGLDPDKTDTVLASSNKRFFTLSEDGDTAISSDDLIDGATGRDDIIAKYQNITAKNFTVSSDIMNDTNTIAAADALGEDANINVLNNLIDIRSNANLFEEGSPEDFMDSLVATLGIDVQQADTFADSQEAIVKQVDNKRMSVSGVELNEELSNMIKYQQSYKAAASMINTMNEVYDTLINGLGIG